MLATTSCTNESPNSCARPIPAEPVMPTIALISGVCSVAGEEVDLELRLVSWEEADLVFCSVAGEGVGVVLGLAAEEEAVPRFRPAAGEEAGVALCALPGTEVVLALRLLAGEEIALGFGFGVWEGVRLSVSKAAESSSIIVSRTWEKCC